MGSGRLYYALGSEKGINRSTNKDSVCVVDTNFENVILFAVFDGVSSSRHAKFGVNFVSRFIQKQHHNYVLDDCFDIKKMLLDANDRLVRSKYQNPESTIVLGFADLKKFIFSFVSLGDTRVYAVSNQYIRQMSVDDNPYGQKNIVTKYLGMHGLQLDDIETGIVDFKKENALICTDGFYKVMEENLLAFHESFMLKTAHGIEGRIKRHVVGSNADDATYLYLGIKNV